MSEIIHQANQQQFICMVEGKESRLRYRRLDAKTIDAYSTFVPPRAAGAGDCRSTGARLLQLDSGGGAHYSAELSLH